VIRFLLARLERSCREEWGICCIEAEVSAYAPRMQRTLLELGYLPAAYLPALVFHHVERLDAVRMIRLMIPPDVATEVLPPAARLVADLVLQRFRSKSVLPRFAETSSANRATTNATITAIVARFSWGGVPQGGMTLFVSHIRLFSSRYRP
jgi:hypothetical protein